MIDNSRRANLTASFLGLVPVLSIDAPSVRAQAAETFKGPAERQIQVMAEAGQVDAQLQMARLYLDGRSVPRDRTLAYFWFNIAAANGSGEAATERDKLEKSLTPAQIAQAEEIARNWKPKEALESAELGEAFSQQLRALLVDASSGFASGRTTNRKVGRNSVVIV